MRREVSLILGIVVGIGIGLLIMGILRADDAPTISDSTDETGSASSEITLGVDSPAPNFELVSLSGEQVQLEDFQGQVVLLNFWATWCGPCRLEMPAFQERSETFAEDLKVVAVNFDEPQADVQAFVDELGLTFEILLDPGAEIQRLYLVRGYPTSYFIDAEGVVRVLHIGVMTDGQLDDYLADLGISG
jgi:peroxiredoxin